jgi:hypothetical protein
MNILFLLEFVMIFSTGTQVAYSLVVLTVLARTPVLENYCVRSPSSTGGLGVDYSEYSGVVQMNHEQ